MFWRRDVSVVPRGGTIDHEGRYKCPLREHLFIVIDLAVDVDYLNTLSGTCISFLAGSEESHETNNARSS